MRDPWEPLVGRPHPETPVLTSVEISVTNLCNLRCEHCAVGEMLAPAENGRLPVPVLTAALDGAPDLLTLSLTGGEPAFSPELVRDWLVPLCRYARDRGLAVQLNTNLTHDLARYLPLEGLVDVLHITWNYADPGEFARIARVPAPAAAHLFARILDNAAALAARGWFVSAESMMAPETLAHLGRFNRRLAAAGCRRHEVHPRYPVDWAAHLPVTDLGAMAAAIHRLLDERDPGFWVLFGTFPFLPCSPDPAHRALWQRVSSAPGVTIRNDPDGRSRLNVDGLTGAVRVTDFADLPPLGNILAGARLPDCLAAWQKHPACQPYRCCCPEAACLGPNLIVASTYYPEADFATRKAIVDPTGAGARAPRAGHRAARA